MVDIFTEVDEDLRREKLAKVWKQFGGYIIAAVVIIIGGMAARVYWNDYQAKQKKAESGSYQTALAELQEGERDEALQALDRLSKDSNLGYGLLSKLQIAGALAKSGDADGALEIYSGISADSKYDSRYRDFASLMAGVVFVDQKKYDEARVHLEPLATKQSSWSFSASEILGLINLEQGNWADAERLFLGISIDQRAPPDMKARAGEYLKIIDARRPRESINEIQPLAEDEEPVAEDEGQEN